MAATADAGLYLIPDAQQRIAMDRERDFCFAIGEIWVVVFSAVLVLSARAPRTAAIHRRAESGGRRTTIPPYSSKCGGIEVGFSTRQSTHPSSVARTSPIVVYHAPWAVVWE